MFKKTVSMHEVFLQRLAAHPVLRHDNNFRVFLEYKEEVSVASILCTSNNHSFAAECSRKECQRATQWILQNVNENRRWSLSGQSKGNTQLKKTVEN